MKRILLALLLVLLSGYIAWAVVTLRQDKGSPLTHEELDDNFITLHDWIYTSPGGFSWTLDPGGVVNAETVTIPAAGGAVYSALTFTDVTTDIIYATMLRAPVGWTTGTILATAQGVHIGASPSGEALGFDVAAQCRRDNDALNNTWGTAQALTLSFSVQNRLESALTAAITPNGTCSGGTQAAPVYVNVRFVVNTTNFVCATPANCKLLAVDLQFVRP